jgi:hypothetical protein
MLLGFKRRFAPYVEFFKNLCENRVLYLTPVRDSATI